MGKKEEEIDLELRRLGRSISHRVDSSPAISGVKEAVLTHALLAFQQSQQQAPARGVSWLRISRLVTTAAVTACIAMLVSDSPRLNGNLVAPAHRDGISMDDLTVALNSFSENFSADFPTYEQLEEVSYDDSPFEELDAGFYDNTTSEDLENEFEAA